MPDQLFGSEMFGYEPGSFTDASHCRIGKIQHASGGTLFLDEIESMPVALQVKLLRVLQDQKVERLGSNERFAVNVRVPKRTLYDKMRKLGLSTEEFHASDARGRRS
jgi:two-component system, NtrC family, C4-dicarboxylate transport response regulator DctD